MHVYKFYILYDRVQMCLNGGLCNICLETTRLPRIDQSDPSILGRSSGCLIVMLSYSQSYYLPRRRSTETGPHYAQARA